MLLLAVLAMTAVVQSLPIFSSEGIQMMGDLLMDEDADMVQMQAMMQEAGIVERPPTPACDWTPFPQCGNAFFANFQLTVGPSGFPASPMDFGRAVDQLVNNTNVAGWTNLRNWFDTFRNCTGGWRNFNGCMSVNNTMTNMGVNHTVAVFWDIEMRTVEYLVGPAFQVMTQNWFCIQNVAVHEGPHIQTCRDTFNQSEINHPSRFCDHFANFLYCIERPYARNCGNAVGGVICNSERIAYETSHPECQATVAFHCQMAPQTTTASSGK